MNLEKFLALLENHPDESVAIRLPDGTHVPAHFHVTEVGHVQKRFVDCGGTLRSATSCVLQVWVANDTEHRLNTTKLSKILDKGLACSIIGMSLWKSSTNKESFLSTPSGQSTPSQPA